MGSPEIYKINWKSPIIEKDILGFQPLLFGWVSLLKFLLPMICGKPTSVGCPGQFWSDHGLKDFAIQFPVNVVLLGLLYIGLIYSDNTNSKYTIYIRIWKASQGWNKQKFHWLASTTPKMSGLNPQDIPIKANQTPTSLKFRYGWILNGKKMDASSHHQDYMFSRGSR